MVIVSDGRKKINSRTLSVLATQGIYKDGIAKNVVNGKPVTCHVSNTVCCCFFNHIDMVRVDIRIHHSGCRNSESRL